MSMRVSCRNCQFAICLNEAESPAVCPQCGEAALEASPRAPAAESGSRWRIPAKIRASAVRIAKTVALAALLSGAFLAGRFWPDDGLTIPRLSIHQFADVGTQLVDQSSRHEATEVDGGGANWPETAPSHHAAPEIRSTSPVDFGPEPPRPLSETFPRLIVEGQSFVHQLPRTPGVQYELVDGPAGLSVTPGGKVTWLPSRKQLGAHELKIRVKQNGAMLFERPSVEVIDQKLADAAAGSESQRQPRPPAPLPRDVLPTVPAAEFHALGAAEGFTPLTSKEIGRRYLNAVVVVHSDKSVGTGFVVGKNGYVLTCAHVLPHDGQMILAYNLAKDGRTEAISTTASLVLADPVRDLALLKIEPREPLPCVVLHDGKSVETGEVITVIGNPGLGETILTHTMTTGIVSNSDRELDGQRYIQTSAVVNPGNSGGPMFDSYGRVIGLVSLKGDIEGTGFAVPARVLREFLTQLISVNATSSKGFTSN
jgi:serine protease Do